MANSADTNPIVIDTVSEVVRSTPLFIKNIKVDASADDWVVILKDSAGGNIIFSSKSEITDDRGGVSQPIGIWVDGIYPDTLTNITRVLVYEEAR